MFRQSYAPWQRASIAVLTLAAACSLGDRPRRPAPTPSTAAARARIGMPAPGGTAELPPETDSSLVRSAPIDLGTTLCPGLRLGRVDRRRRDDASAVGPVPPRYFARDDTGRYYTVQALLLCELRNLGWVARAPEDATLSIRQRGPWIVTPDEDCEWHEPVRTEAITGGRRLTAVERCRRHGRPGIQARTVVVEVSEDYGQFRAH